MNRLYRGAGIFRAHPGKGGNTTQPGGARGDRTWNGNFNTTSSKVCSHFNFNRDHPATALQPDGKAFLPTTQPISKHWIANRCRPVIGVESMLFQGFPMLKLPGSESFHDTLLQDLAGNAYCGTVVLAVHAAALLPLLHAAASGAA